MTRLWMNLNWVYLFALHSCVQVMCKVEINFISLGKYFSCLSSLVDFLFVLHFAFYWFPFLGGQLSLCCVNCVFALLMLLGLFRSLLRFWVFSVEVKCQDLLGLVGLARDRVGGLKARDPTYSLGLIVECSPLSIDVHINEVEVNNGDN